MAMETSIEAAKKELIMALSCAISIDEGAAAEVGSRLKENRALLASLQKHGAKIEFDPNSPPPTRLGMTRFRRGPKYAVLRAIESLQKKRFTGEDVFEEVERLFPATVTRPQISSLLWKMSSSDKSKERVQSIRKVKTSNGGKTQALYEMCHQDLKPSNAVVHANGENDFRPQPERRNP